MTRWKLAVLWATFGLATTMGLMPPWKYTTHFSEDGVSAQSQRPAGYAFIGSPPARHVPDEIGNDWDLAAGFGVEMDLTRLAAQYVVLGIVAGGLLLTLHLLKQEVRLDVRRGAPSSTIEVNDAPEHRTSVARVGAVQRALARWVRIRPLDVAGSIGAVSIASTLALFHCALQADSLGLAFPQGARVSGIVGAMTGAALASFALYVVSGWGGAAVAYWCFGRSRTSALIGFVGMGLGVFILLTARIEHPDHRAAAVQAVPAPQAPRPQVQSAVNQFGDPPASQDDIFDRVEAEALRDRFGKVVHDRFGGIVLKDQQQAPAAR